MIARRCDASAANRRLCEEPVEMPRRSTGRFSTVVQTDKNVFSELLGTLLVRAVFFFLQLHSGYLNDLSLWCFSTCKLNLLAHEAACQHNVLSPPLINNNPDFLSL